jgi:c(7)-type cytochrome triheme protein
MKALGKLTFWKVVLGISLALGAYALYVRLFEGLGASTHLSDRFPWGLWVGFDVLTGVGLAAGGFVMAATVHVFHLEKYEPVARPSVLTAFLGYVIVGVALMLDIGQPWRIWHPVIYWNHHSVMFEVSWCVMLYLSVLALEFAPMALEKLGWKAPLQLINKLFIVLVVAGCVLSTLHQSSLGTVYLIAPTKLYGLWYSPLLPLFFYITAIAAGLAMTIFESCMSHRAFRRHLEHDVLQGLARGMVVILGMFAVLKFGDLSSRGNLALAFEPTPEALMFWGEMGLGVLLPLFMMSFKTARENHQSLFLAAVLVVLGFIVGRLNVAMTGLVRSSGVSYFPSFTEVSLSIFFIAITFLIFALCVKYLNVFPAEHGVPAEPARLEKPLLSGAAVVALWVLMAIGVGGMTWAIQREAAARPAPAAPVPAAKIEVDELRLPPPFAFPSGPKSPGKVTFHHDDHVRPAKPNCMECHLARFQIDEPTKFANMKEAHTACGTCHDGDKASAIEDSCDSCHVDESARADGAGDEK